MTSLDGIIPVPHGLKQEIRRLVIIVFMLAPIGVLATVAAIGPHTGTASSLTSSPAVPAQHPTVSPFIAPTSPQPAPEPSPASGNISSSLELHTSQSATGAAPTTQLKVNNQSVTVPSDGSVHKVMSNDSGTTTLDISNSSSSVSDSSSSSTNIQLNTSSSTFSNNETSAGP